MSTATYTENVKDCPLLPFAGVHGVCDRCGKKLTGRRVRWCSSLCNRRNEESHWWKAARRAAKWRDKYRCVKCGASKKDGAKLEVNHIIPRRGQGYGRGCWHHQDNLETVCVDCHRVITREQMKARKREEVERLGQSEQVC